MRWIPWVMLLLFAAPCWGDAEPVKRGKEKALASEVRDLLFRIQSASESGDGEALLALISVDGMLARIQEAGHLKSLSGVKRLGVSRALRSVLEFVVRGGKLIDGTGDYVFRHVRSEAKPGHHVAYFWVREEGLLIQKLHVHLERVNGSLCVVDLTDLDAGLSHTTLLGALVVETANLTDGEMESPFRAMQEAADLLEQGELERARDRLLWLESAELPDLFHVAIQLLLARAAMEMEEPEEVLARVRLAEGYPYEFPGLIGLRASALNDLGKHGEALVQARRYIALADEDAEVAVEIGIAHRGLGQSAQAVAAFERAAALEPMWHVPVVYLAIALPEERMAEVGEFFAKVRDLDQWFVAMAELCLDEDELPALRCLVGLFKSLHPGHRDGLFYEGRAFYEGDQPEDAAGYFDKAMRAVGGAGLDAEAMTVYFDYFLDALYEAGEPIDAYTRCTDQAYAFRHLASRLVEDAQFTALRKLMAEAAENPDLKWDLAYQPGEIDYACMRYEEAVERLRVVYGEMMRRPLKEREGEEESFDVLWFVEDRLVRALVRTRRLDEALRIARAAQERLAAEDYVCYLPLVVHAHRKDVEKTRAAAQALIAAGEEPGWVFEDEDAGSILAGEAYKDLREKHYPRR